MYVLSFAINFRKSLFEIFLVSNKENCEDILHTLYTYYIVHTLYNVLYSAECTYYIVHTLYNVLYTVQYYIFHTLYNILHSLLTTLYFLHFSCILGDI